MKALILGASLAAAGLAAAADGPVRIVLVGDSTVTDHSGWGQAFADRLAPGVVCSNLARGGQSTKSYLDEGRCYAPSTDPNDAPGQDVTGISDPLASYHAFIDRVMKQYDSLALIFEFVTVNAERSIYDQHKTVREMFQQRRRRPWAEWNRQALAEWLGDHPAFAQEAP